MSVFQDLYDSEINFSISTMWDGGFDVALGDDMNGFKAKTTVSRFSEIEPWLIKVAIEHRPQSLFARMYRDDNEQKRHCRIGKVTVKSPPANPYMPPYRFDRPPMWPDPCFPGVAPSILPWWDRVTCGTASEQIIPAHGVRL